MSIEDIRDLFYLGYYNKVIDARSSIRDNEEVEYMMAYSYLSLKQVDFVLNKGETTPVRKGACLFGRCLKLEGDKDKILEILSNEIDQDMISNSCYYAIFAAIVNIKIKDYYEALKILNKFDDQNVSVIRIQALLGINRVDLAEYELKQITNGISNTVAKTYVGLIKGEEETKAALFSLLDLYDRYQDSPVILNLMVACHYAVGEWENGQNIVSILHDKFNNDPSVDINYAIGLSHSSEFSKFKTQISLVKNYKNSYNSSILSMLKDFDKTAENLETQ